MKAQILASLLVFLLLASYLALVSAEENRPVIRVFEGKPPRSYPLKIYAYPQAYEYNGKELFQCGRTQEIISTLYDVLRELHQVVTRFIDEYPEYRKLALIYFVNATSISEADIAFKVVGSSTSELESFGYTLYSSSRPIEVGIICKANLSRDDFFTTIMHELLHALGLMHAKQPSTDDGSPELMNPTPPTGVKIYPSTLDLYALYVVHFTDFERDLITLPESIEYKMVVPYSYELQSLRQENKQLKDVLAKTQKENYVLRGKLRNANAIIETLQRELESTKNDLSSYIKSYNILWFENRDLRNNLSRLYNACNQSISLLVLKLNQTYNDYTNLTSRYNWLVRTYNNLYQDYQTYKEGYETAMQRLYLVGIIAYASLSILLFAYLRVARKYNKLLSEYDKLVEYLGVGEHGREG
jgi:regulator of replication initiation timing